MARRTSAIKPVGNPKTPATRADAERRATAAIVREFWAARGERTRHAYEADLKTLQRYLGTPSAGEALAAVLRAGPGGAFRIANGYKASLVEAGLAAATINRRLSSLRALVKFARASGLVNWALEVENVNAERRRDTRGPGSAGVQALLAEVARGNGKKAVRDRALLRVLYDLGLRRAEASQLDAGDVYLDGDTISVRGKGRREKVRLSLPEPTAEALRAWLAVRGDANGPLFTSFDRSGSRGAFRPAGSTTSYAGTRRGRGCARRRTGCATPPARR
jgi:integrase/recombinase XerC